MADQKISDLADGGATEVDDYFVVARGAANFKLLPEDTTVGAITGNCKNVSGSTILKGAPLYQVGTAGQTPEVAPADAGDPTKMPAIGLADEDILDEEEGLILYLGRIKNVNTSGFSEGDTIFVGVGGGTTNVAPSTLSPPGINQYLGRVLKVANVTSPPNGSGMVLGTGIVDVVPAGATAGLVQFRGTDGLFASDSTFTFNASTKKLGAKLLEIDAGTNTTSTIATRIKQVWDPQAIGDVFHNFDIDVDALAAFDSNLSSVFRIRSFFQGAFVRDAYRIRSDGSVIQTGSLIISAEGTGGTRGIFSSGGSDILTLGSQFYLVGNNDRIVMSGLVSRGFGFGSSSFPGAASRHDAGWHRDGAGILGQRAGTTAQSYRIYRTFVTDTNFARVNLTLDSTEFKIQPDGEGASENADVDIHLAPKGTGLLRIGTAYEAEASPTFITGYIRVKDSTGAILKLAVINEGTSP